MAVHEPLPGRRCRRVVVEPTCVRHRSEDSRPGRTRLCSLNLLLEVLRYMDKTMLAGRRRAMPSAKQASGQMEH